MVALCGPVRCCVAVVLCGSEERSPPDRGGEIALVTVLRSGGGFVFIKRVRLREMYSCVTFIVSKHPMFFVHMLSYTYLFEVVWLINDLFVDCFFIYSVDSIVSDGPVYVSDKPVHVSVKPVLACNEPVLGAIEMHQCGRSENQNKYVINENKTVGDANRFVGTANERYNVLNMKELSDAHINSWVFKGNKQMNTNKSKYMR